MDVKRFGVVILDVTIVSSVIWERDTIAVSRRERPKLISSTPLRDLVGGSENCRQESLRDVAVNLELNMQPV